MSHFIPNLIPEHHMHTALISSEEFYARIYSLAPRFAYYLLYVRDRETFMIAPLHRLAEVQVARNEAKKSNPELADYLRELIERWVVIIAKCALEHPLRSRFLKGIDTALCGKLPVPPPWTIYFEQALVTGDDNQIYLPANSRLCSSEEEQGWGLSSEPAADLLRVLDLLGYGRPETIKRGVKPKGN